jgi:hypothetical protein
VISLIFNDLFSQLEREIEESYGHFRSHNESKNIFKAANTPITLAAVAMIFYMFSQILGMIGLYPFANLLNLLMLSTFLLLTTWGYVKYTGNLSDVGSSIDTLAVTVWEAGLQPALSRLAEEGTQLAARQAVQRLNSTATPPSGNLQKKHN